MSFFSLKCSSFFALNCKCGFHFNRLSQDLFYLLLRLLLLLHLIIPCNVTIELPSHGQKINQVALSTARSASEAIWYAGAQFWRHAINADQDPLVHILAGGASLAQHNWRFLNTGPHYAKPVVSFSFLALAFTVWNYIIQCVCCPFIVLSFYWDCSNPCSVVLNLAKIDLITEVWETQTVALVLVC